MPCALNRWITGDWFACMFDPVTATTGETGFGLLVGATLIMALYLAGDGSMATPSVAIILFAGVMVPVLPGAYVGVAQGVAIIGVFAALLAVGQKYVLSPSTA